MFHARMGRERQTERERQWTPETFASPIVSPKRKCFIILTCLLADMMILRLPTTTKILLLCESLTRKLATRKRKYHKEIHAP